MSQKAGKNGFMTEFIRPNSSLQKGPRRLLFYLILFTTISSGIFGAAKFSPESRCQYLASLFLIFNMVMYIFLIMVWSFVPPLGFGLFIANFVAMSSWGIHLLITEMRLWKGFGLDEAGGYYCNYSCIGLAFLVTGINCGILLFLTSIALIQVTNPKLLHYQSQTHSNCLCEHGQWENS